jgi:hypothetical protein
VELNSGTYIVSNNQFHYSTAVLRRKLAISATAEVYEIYKSERPYAALIW